MGQAQGGFLQGLLADGGEQGLPLGRSEGPVALLVHEFQHRMIGCLQVIQEGPQEAQEEITGHQRLGIPA